jgi:hypothetical protein
MFGKMSDLTSNYYLDKPSSEISSESISGRGGLMVALLCLLCPFPEQVKKGLLSLGEIGYILFLYIIQNCMLCKNS